MEEWPSPRNPRPPPAVRYVEQSAPCALGARLRTVWSHDPAAAPPICTLSRVQYPAIMSYVVTRSAAPRAFARATAGVPPRTIQICKPCDLRQSPPPHRRRLPPAVPSVGMQSAERQARDAASRRAALRSPALRSCSLLLPPEFVRRIDPSGQRLHSSRSDEQRVLKLRRSLAVPCGGLQQVGWASGRREERERSEVWKRVGRSVCEREGALSDAVEGGRRR